MTNKSRKNRKIALNFSPMKFCSRHPNQRPELRQQWTQTPSYRVNHNVLGQKDDESDAILRFWTDIRDAYILSPNDASLASIVENRRCRNPHLTLFDDYPGSREITLDVNTGVDDTPDPEPIKTPPTTNASLRPR